MISPEKIPDLAKRIGYTELAIRRATQSGRYSERLALLLERELQLPPGSIPRSEQREIQRIRGDQVREFHALLEELRSSTSLNGIARLMNTHYECARAVCSQRIRPSILHVRSLASLTNDPRWLRFDDENFELPKEPKSDLGRAIRDRRLELDLTLADVAQKVGISVGSLSRYETRGNVPNSRLQSLASALATTVNSLLGTGVAHSPGKAA